MLITGAIIGAALLGGGYFAWHHFHVKHRLAALEKAAIGTEAAKPGVSFSVPSSLPANTTSPSQPVVNLTPAA